MSRPTTNDKWPTNKEWNANKEWLTEKEFSEYTGLSIKTLRNQRAARKGCPFYKPSGARTVLYRTKDINRWIENGFTETHQ